MTVKAAVVDAVGETLEIRDLELDHPRADEVQVRMVATGVCHTDAVVQAGWIPTTFPVVLGHEGAGIVEKVGPGVTDLRAGDHVVLSFDSCGQCRSCLSGHPAYCLESYRHNFAGGRADGSTSFTDAAGHPVTSHFFGQSSFAERSNVAVRSVVKVPEDMPLELLAPLGCGVQTGAGAVLNVLRPRAGGSFVVFGTGAVGFSALLAAVSQRVGTIIAVDVVPARLEFARELGATHTINGAEEDALARILEITGGGVETALDTTGNARVFAQMIDALAVGGHAGALGAAAAGAEGVVALPTALSRGIRITWVVEGDAVPQLFIPELIAMYRAGDFPYDRLIKTYDFADIRTAFSDSEKGETLKPVVLFGEG